MRLRFVDRLLGLEPRARLRATKCVSFEEAMLLRPGLARGAPHTLALEWVGQAAAVLVAESTDYTRLAVLGALGSLRAENHLAAGDVASVDVRVRAWHPDAALFDATVAREDGAPFVTVERALCAFVPMDELVDAEELRAAVRAARGDFPGPVPLR